MTRAGAVLARRLVKATASPGPGHLDYVARRLGRPSPRPLEGSLGDALAICRRRLSSSPRAPATPPPPPPTPSPPPPKSWLLGKPSPRLLEGSLGEALAICRRRFHASRGFCSSACAPLTPTPSPPPTSWLDLSPRELFCKMKGSRYTHIVLGAIYCIVMNLCMVIAASKNLVHKVTDMKLAEQDEKDNEAELNELREIEEFEKTEVKLNEEFDAATFSHLKNLTNRILKLENKWNQDLHADDPIQLAITNKLNNIESEVLELKTVLANSSGSALKYAEIGDELSQVESQVSSLKTIVQADKLSKSATTEPESGASKGP